ncbi:MAG TPA: M50 family metallopeptidase [Anaeromyxobacteraceae bacterium]|nr:M50 family metallopeptidase [Anaeromyxobacteraceae bacterium]
MAIVAMVVGVSLLIVVHEAGHFLVARRFGMRVERFSIGFGPVLARFRGVGTEFAISALPLGGYVRIAGMGPGEAVDPQDRGLYSNQPAWRRFAVILAGPAMNYVAAVLVAWGLLATLGLRAPDPAPRIGPLVPGMPAEAAGLRQGDRIVSVAGRPVDTWLGLVQELQRHPAEEIALEVDRGEAGRTVLRITPRNDGGVGRVGFRQAEVVVRDRPVRSLVEAVARTNANAGLQIGAFASLLSRKQHAEITGPVGIAQELVRGARAGAEPFLTLVWTISIVLALLNLFPLPALDGGRLVFLAWEIVTRRRVNERVESYVHFAGFVALVALVLAVTVFKDLVRLLGG